jgi:hypothetical protein
MVALRVSDVLGSWSDDPGAREANEFRTWRTLAGLESVVKQNVCNRGAKLRDNHKAMQRELTNFEDAPRQPGTASTEAHRKYRVQVIVTDPEGQQVLNLTKRAVEDMLHCKGYSAPDIQEALQILVEAAGEWSA